MPRSLYLPTLVALTLTVAPAHAQRRCPFNPQAQLQIQMYWQRQQMLQRQMAQQRAMQMNNRVMQGPRAPAQVYRRAVPTQRTMATARTTRVTTNNTRYAVSRSTQVTTRTVAPSRVAVGGPGNGRPIAGPRPVRIATARSTTGVQRITTSRTRETTTTRRSTSVSTREVATARRSAAGPQRQATRTTRETAKARTTSSDKHTPVVQMKITMTGQCGGCHKCRANTPGITRPPTPIPAIVRPLPMPRPIPGPGIVPGPKPRPGPALVRPGPPKPAPPRVDPLPGLVPLPIVRVLPPVQPGLTPPDRKKDDPKKKSIGERLAATSPTPKPETPPPVPALEPELVGLKSGLVYTSAPVREAPRVTPLVLLPSAVNEVPEVAPLASTRLRLLPNPAGEAADAEEREDPEGLSRIELVSQPPSVAPLPESDVR